MNYTRAFGAAVDSLRAAWVKWNADPKGKRVPCPCGCGQQIRLKV